VKEVLAKLHGGPSGGQLGVNKTLDKVRQKYYWLQARHDVEEWRRRCNTCAASQGSQARSQGLMQPYASIQHQARFEGIAIDVAGPFPQSDQGNQHLLIAVDHFIKKPEAYAIPNQEALTVEEALVTNLFCHIRALKELQSDQGHNFKSFLMQEVLELLGVSKMNTTPLHPQ
jgi:hypothetical protein